jgi:hypothetical protein
MRQGAYPIEFANLTFSWNPRLLARVLSLSAVTAVYAWLNKSANIQATSKVCMLDCLDI